MLLKPLRLKLLKMLLPRLLLLTLTKLLRLLRLLKLCRRRRAEPPCGAEPEAEEASGATCAEA